MKIPLVDLSGISSKTFTALKKTINSTDFILGKDVEKFEKNFAEYIGIKYCIGVGSGADALQLSLKALGVGKGDEVMMPSMTFMATASAVINVGATPVFVDILSTVPLLDPLEIKKKISKKTKVIIPVHLHGFPCDMDAINAIAKKYKLFILEDACQAHGSLYKKKRPGSLSDIATFSFYPSKNLGAFGDGGAITTSDKNLAEKLFLLRNQGASEKYKHDLVGYNSRLDTIQAAVLNVKLTSLDNDNAKRRKNAKMYDTNLKNLPLELPIIPQESEGNYHIYAIQVKERDKLFSYLKERNIYCGVHYPIPLHLQPALTYLKYKKGDFPNSEKFAERTLSLPMYPSLTPQQIKYICREITSFYQSK
jgi:dTDP-4-amino-4,6-dideoxygalactose transaminase